MSDIELIDSIKKNNADSLLTLVSRHERLYFSMINRYKANDTVKRFNFDGEKLYFFYQTALAYDPSRNMKFSSFLASRTKYMCKTLCSQRSSEIELKELHFDIPLSENHDDEKIDLLQKYILTLDNIKARKILMNRYFDRSGKTLTFSTIARKLGMSTRNVKYIHDRFIKLLKNKTQNA